MSCKKIKDLKLTETGKIGYTFKCMGAGFWALKQDNFKKAMIKITMQVRFGFLLNHICHNSVFDMLLLS